MFKIETGIEIPPRKQFSLPTPRAKYPFKIMETGQSFLVPLKETKGDGKKLQARVSAACAAARKTTGRKFATRIVEHGIRVWRVA